MINSSHLTSSNACACDLLWLGKYAFNKRPPGGASRELTLAWMDQVSLRGKSTSISMGCRFSPQGKQEMNSYKNSRFLLSTFTAALMILAWTGPTRADLWVASGSDSMGSYDFEANVTNSSNQIQITISNLSPPGLQTVSDIVLDTSNPIGTGNIVFGSGFAGWSITVESDNSTSFLLTSAQSGPTPGTGGSDIAPGASAMLSLVAVPEGTIVDQVKFSKAGDPTEIPATLVPEPSSIVIATLGALGILGYSLRRRNAK